MYLIVLRSLPFNPVCYGLNKVYISHFYQPPNLGSQVFEDLYNLLMKVVLIIILLGNINVNFCNQTHPLYFQIVKYFESFLLVSDCFWIYSYMPQWGYLHDWPHCHVITFSLIFDFCETIPPLANSDHFGLLLQSQWRQTRQSTGDPARLIWLYKDADWHKACHLFEKGD